MLAAVSRHFARGVRRWCSMSSCGSREKMQRYRAADR
ncbi:CGNR zinc finger domain-containing protein [Amycolatopsis sp. Hca4]